MVRQSSAAFLSTDVGFVAQRGDITVFGQHLATHFQVSGVGRRQLEIEDHAAEGNEQMQFIAEDRLFLGRDLAETGSESAPITGGTRDQIELHHRYRQAVNDARALLRNIEHLQHSPPDKIERVHQISAAPVEICFAMESSETGQHVRASGLA